MCSGGELSAQGRQGSVLSLQGLGRLAVWLGVGTACRMNGGGKVGGRETSVVFLAEEVRSSRDGAGEGQGGPVSRQSLRVERDRRKAGILPGVPGLGRWGVGWVQEEEWA